MATTKKKGRPRRRMTPEQKQRAEELRARELAASQAAYRAANHTAIYGVATPEPLLKHPEPATPAGRKQVLTLQIKQMQAELATL